MYGIVVGDLHIMSPDACFRGPQALLASIDAFNALEDTLLNVCTAVALQIPDTL